MCNFQFLGLSSRASGKSCSEHFVQLHHHYKCPFSRISGCCNPSFLMGSVDKKEDPALEDIENNHSNTPNNPDRLRNHTPGGIGICLYEDDTTLSRRMPLLLGTSQSNKR
mmetsp:Transcript_112337/g.204224  ORF Transcript_112337/g.204224 Transcript_112337/m.204224 type:complete len:110 (+) Transcript_112337:835-1164(+)